ncbi:MAG: hypothetical protein ACXWLQ_04110 [Rhizomicrobium sp.]
MRRLLLAIMLLCLYPANASAAGSWRILKDHWTRADEAGFGRFVAAIGASNCSSSESCLRDPSNPYRLTDQNFVDIDVDCAKWPYLLRGYYAWKNGLPFGYVDSVSGEGGDLRFTHTANRPTSRNDIVDRGEGIDGPAVLRGMLAAVSSATYRTDASEQRGVLSDFYSPELKPGSIRPGTVIYDVNGHVGIVWKVDEVGRIFYMDAHPDFTITRSVYGAQFGQSPLRLGGGLKNWRPFRLARAHRDGGHLVGGHLAYAQNDQIADFSLVQYAGTEPNPAMDAAKARFRYDGDELGFYEYVRVAVSGGRMDFNPVYELKATMKTLCNDLNDRAQYVDLDIKDGVVNKPHPERLPGNIYGSSDDEWEMYSTPSRDARIRAAAVQFYKDMRDMIEMWVKRDPRIVYDGNFLKNDLARTYSEQSRACTITYLNSSGRPVAMTFDDMMHRLFAMSFDPFHCVELRWGASGDERNSCTNGKAKLRWYEAEQRLRNQPDGTFDINMAFTLEDLDRHAKGSGIDKPPPVDIKALIDNMPERIGFEGMGPVGR